MKRDIVRAMAAARKGPRKKGKRKPADAARALRRVQFSEVLDGIRRIEEIDRKCRAQLTKLTGVGYLDLRIVAIEKRLEELERFHAAARAGGFSAVAAPAEPTELEAIQDEEAILRLALALRATSQWFTAAATAPQVLWKLAEFLDNPEYARTAIKAGGGRPR